MKRYEIASKQEVDNLKRDKVNKVPGKGLSEFDFSRLYKEKLDGLEQYVGNKVKTDVPVNALFTDTVYYHPRTHPYSMITDTPTSLPANGGNADTVGGFKVEKDVLANAQLTDTTTSVNGKTGVITKEDIVALGIPAQDTIVSLEGVLSKEEFNNRVKTDVPLGAVFTDTDTIYTHPETHPYSMITGVPTSLPASGGDAATVNGKTVGVDVPIGAVFTDTVTSINGNTGEITKADIVALGIPAQDTVVSTEGFATQVYVDDRVKTPVPLNAKFTDTVVDITNKVDKSQVLTNVPANAVFTDTIVDVSGKADKSYVDNKVKTDVPMGAVFTDTNTITSINNKTGVITKEDIVALGIPAQDTQVDTSEFLTKKNGVLETYTEKLVTIGGTPIINLSEGNVFIDAPTSDRTYSIANAKSGVAHSFTLRITQPNTPIILTFPASVNWGKSGIPDMTTANKLYILTFMTVDGGITWEGMFGGEF